VETSFEEGDWLVLYTDGISEAKGRSTEEFGESGLRLFLENHRDGTAASFADTLLNDVSLWAGGGEQQNQDDDVTLVAVHFQGSARAVTAETVARSISVSSAAAF
jgi:serine phosphatase RsbU (regulator of sigma subunit)